MCMCVPAFGRARTRVYVCICDFTIIIRISLDTMPFLSCCCNAFARQNNRYNNKNNYLTLTIYSFDIVILLINRATYT